MRNPVPVFLCALAIGWAGCATPRSEFYTLHAPAAAPGASAPRVAVGPVSIPSLVDRPQIVVRTGPNRVFIDEFHRWGSPLRDDIARVVAGNLASLLEASSGAYRVRIDVTAFDSVPGEAAVLEAAWTVRAEGSDGDRSRPSRSGRTAVREPVKGEGYEALAAAHSRALEVLSKEIAEAVRTLEGGGK
ncbi:MAG: PqiC family protein [Thermodesulfobacteriota bacterium]